MLKLEALATLEHIAFNRGSNELRRLFSDTYESSLDRKSVV